MAANPTGSKFRLFVLTHFLASTAFSGFTLGCSSSELPLSMGIKGVFPIALLYSISSLIDENTLPQPLTSALSVAGVLWPPLTLRSEEHTSELQSRRDLVCRLLLEKKKEKKEHQ